MIINNVTNENFKGGYRFRSMPQEARAKLPETIHKYRQIFYDFENKGDVFLVTRDKVNGPVAKFIHEHGLDFEFYPSINTKMGLDDEKPEGLSALLKTIKTPPITTRTQLQKRINTSASEAKVEKYSSYYVPNILKALFIDAEGLETKIINGISVVDNPEFKRKIHISRRGKDKIHYVLVQPYSIGNSSEHYSIDSNGKIVKVHKTPEEIKEFYRGFRKSILK